MKLTTIAFATLITFSISSLGQTSSADSTLTIEQLQFESWKSQQIQEVQQKISELSEVKADFWHNQAVWFTSIIAGVLALISLMFILTEIVKRRTVKSLKRIKQELRHASAQLDFYATSTSFQSVYIEQVLKPTLTEILDVIADPGGKRGRENKVNNIYEKYTDFEHVIDLFNPDERKAQAAESYILTRKSKYVNAKLETISRQSSEKEIRSRALSILAKMNDSL